MVNKPRSASSPTDLNLERIRSTMRWHPPVHTLTFIIYRDTALILFSLLCPPNRATSLISFSHPLDKILRVYLRKCVNKLIIFFKFRKCKFYLPPNMVNATFIHTLRTTPWVIKYSIELACKHGDLEKSHECRHMRSTPQKRCYPPRCHAADNPNLTCMISGL